VITAPGLRSVGRPIARRPPGRKVVPISVGEQFRLLQQVSCQRISRDLKSGAGTYLLPRDSRGAEKYGTGQEWQGLMLAAAR
jgi:hypothetical protein